MLGEKLQSLTNNQSTILQLLQLDRFRMRFRTCFEPYMVLIDNEKATYGCELKLSLNKLMLFKTHKSPTITQDFDPI